MRVVLDTNILISALVSDTGYPSLAIDLWFAGHYQLVTSTWQLEEFRTVSRYPHIRRYFGRAEAGTLLNGIRSNAVVVEALPRVDLSSDPDDNFILAAAIAGDAHYLVTGDKSDLQALGMVQGIRILTVRVFVGMFKKIDW